jgi:hypothetical protein
LQQPPNSVIDYWSPDRQWWWNGSQWVPAAQAPVPPPPPSWTPPAPISLAPSPGLRTFLIVLLVITSVIWGLLTLFGVLGIAQDVTQSASLTSAQQSTFNGGLVFFGVIAMLFAVSLIATVGVLMRASWARWAAIVAGIASCLTCLGLVLGIPILVAAARAPGLAKSRSHRPGAN